LRRTLIRSRVDAHNQMAGVLTKEQRAQVRAMGPWWLEDEAED
jgi:Spy/CpxP family protein refolding chaperone